MQDLIKQLIQAKNELADIDDKKKQATQAVNDIKMQIRAELESIGLNSARTDYGTVSIVNKKSQKIVNEAKVMSWLRETPDIEEDLYLTVNKKAFEALNNAWFKDTGEIIDGVETVTSEYLSFKEKK